MFHLFFSRIAMGESDDGAGSAGPKQLDLVQPTPGQQPSGDAIAAVISQRDSAIDKVKNDYETKFAAMAEEQVKAKALLEKYHAQEDEATNKIYTGLDDKQKELADAVKPSMDREGFKAYLELLTKNKADSGDDSAPGFPRGGDDDLAADDEIPAGKYKVKFAEEIESRLGEAPQYLQHARVLNDASGMRVQVPLKQFKKLIRKIQGEQLAKKG